jgi:hypothetical protein
VTSSRSPRLVLKQPSKPPEMGELKLLPCSHSDAAEILEGQFAAFSNPHEEFFFCLFPKGEDREVAVKRVVEWWVEDESARYMKVVDVESGEFASYCLASVIKRGGRECSGGLWKERAILEMRILIN